MRHTTQVFLIGLTLAALDVSAASVAAQSTVEAARWMPYDMIVDLNGLPKRYSCNDLWYKFRDVLWNIGARRIGEILPYACTNGLGADARSPRVHVAFSLLSPVHSASVATALPQGRSTTVELRPGQPRSLDASDCELVRQMSDTLLAALPVRVDSSRFECSAVDRAHQGFDLSLQTFTPRVRPRFIAGRIRVPRPMASASVTDRE